MTSTSWYMTGGYVHAVTSTDGQLEWWGEDTKAGEVWRISPLTLQMINEISTLTPVKLDTPFTPPPAAYTH